jgi:nicotinamidase-related amidase
MLQRESTGLIVIDIQGKLAGLVHDSDTLLSNCRKLITGAKILNLPVILLEQNPDKLGTTVDELKLALETTNTIKKFTFDACSEPTFIDAINAGNVDTWLICGIETHICVYQTVLHLQQLGIKTELVTDCISSRTLANKTLAINKLVNKGIHISGLEMCLYELVKDCRTTEFKEILTLIK